MLKSLQSRVERLEAAQPGTGPQTHVIVVFTGMTDEDAYHEYAIRTGREMRDGDFVVEVRFGAEPARH